MMRIFAIFAFISLCGVACVSGVLVEDVRDQVIHEVESAWRKLQGLESDPNKPLGQVLKDLSAIVSRIPDTISRVERELTVYEYDEALKSLGKVKNTTRTWREKWSEIALLTSPVDILYGHFKIFPEMPEAFLPGSGYDFDINSLTELILKPLYNTDEKGTITLKYLIENVHTAAISRTRRERDAFHILSDQIEEALRQSYWCLWNGKTPQRIVYGFYETLAAFDIKEYTLLNFAWMLKFAINGTEVKNQVVESKEALLQRTDEKTMIAKEVMATASSGYWKCDPIKYQAGVNYAEFKELLQGYIENENKMHTSGSCKQGCADYAFIKARCAYPDDESCFHHRVCTGNLIECKYIAADATVCPADAPRRFDYIEYKRGPTLGSTSKKCSKTTETRNSHWRFLYHCSNCFCLCDDARSPTTVRHVSISPATSDVSANKVVTGVQFVMKEGILHLQIEQGEAEKEGDISDGTTEWKALPNLDKYDESRVTVLEYTRRSFDLDDLVVPKDHVVTGVKFRVLGGHLNLEVQATQINPETGKLIIGSSHWVSNDNTPEAANNGRKLLPLDELDVPTLSKHPSAPDSTHDQYLQFGPTSRYKDVSQTTIPFIDLQEVRPNPPVWLRGIGVYHKGQPGYGGFVAPRVFTISIVDFIKVGGSSSSNRYEISP